MTGFVAVVVKLAVWEASGGRTDSFSLPWKYPVFI
jgi:hypothetical protein